MQVTNVECKIDEQSDKKFKCAPQNQQGIVYVEADSLDFYGSNTSLMGGQTQNIIGNDFNFSWNSEMQKDGDTFFNSNDYGVCGISGGKTVKQKGTIQTDELVCRQDKESLPYGYSPIKIQD